MAVLEQLVFGFRTDADQRRSVLAQSPGLTRECAEEVVRLCEGWGAVPADGVRRSVLMSFPLITRLVGLPGDLYAVIQVAQGLKPIYHAVVINLSDYLDFDLNPYTLAQEDIFLSAWEPGLGMTRIEVQPGSLAPMVSPPPGPSDLGSVDEAVRQMLANQRLLLPLERSSSDSDRFLALAVACLPRMLRQDLRFAAWAPSGTNRYSLAATYRESAMFTSWQPYLMTSIVGDIGPTCDEYLGEIRRCLRDGDLTGLERVSATSRVQLNRPGSGVKRGQPRALTATVQESAARLMERRAGPQPGRPGPARRLPGGNLQTGSRAAPRITNPVKDRRPRPRRLRARNSNRFRRTLALGLTALILAAGGYFFWASGHWHRLPAHHPPVSLSLRLDPKFDVVDVGHLYQRIITDPQQAGTVEVAAVLDDDRRRRGLAALLQASELLTQQSQDYVESVDLALAGPAPHEPVTVDPQHLLNRGRMLTSELRRLALAQISLDRQIDWQDLAHHDGQQLQARLDSLLRRRQPPVVMEPSLAAVRQLLSSVDGRTRQLGGLVTLETLLAQDQWDPGWDRRCETAIDQLMGVRFNRVRQLRDDTFLLIRLKRAEHATDMAARAYTDDYGPQVVTTPAVADILPDLHARTDASSADAPPALLRATAAVYTILARATAPDASVQMQLEASEELAANRAVQFDPAIYGDHLARLRFASLQRLVAAGTPRSALPAACFGDGPAQEHLAFLDILAHTTDPVVWRLHAETLTDPFLIRWSLHQAGSLDTALAD